MHQKLLQTIWNCQVMVKRSYARSLIRVRFAPSPTGNAILLCHFINTSVVYACAKIEQKTIINDILY